LREMDPEVRQILLRQMQRHRECIDTATKLHHKLLDEEDPTSNQATSPYRQHQKCEEKGARYYHLVATGNDTSFFPEESSFCLPPVCVEGVLREYYMPSLVYRNMMAHPSVPLTILALRRSLRAARIRMDLVINFPDDVEHPKIEFVIAGFPLSGTTTLFEALKQHPQIVGVKHEDSMLWKHMHTHRDTIKWSKQYFKALDKKKATLPANFSKRFVFGLKEPMMVYSSLVVQALARAKRLKIIVMVREPFAMVESWIKHASNWITPHGDALDYHAALQHRTLTQLLLNRVPKNRILLVPTAALAREPMKTYQRVLRFIGLDGRTTMGQQALAYAKRRNKWVPVCTWFGGGCFRLCDPPNALFRDLLFAFLNADRVYTDKLLEDHGWPAQLRGIMRPPKCLSQKQVIPDDELSMGICSAASGFATQSCFQADAECMSCCFRMEGECEGYGGKWARCCGGIQTYFNDFLMAEGRKLVCQVTHSKGPCCTGKWNKMFNIVP